MNQQDEAWQVGKIEELSDSVIKEIARSTYAAPYTGEPFELSQIRAQYERMKEHAANQEDKVKVLEDENRGYRMAFKLIVRELKEMK
jgi:hypothetical protein